MSINGQFVDEMPDIMRLESNPGNDGLDRKGWVNVGAFAVSIETNQNGDILVELYPCANEDPSECMGTITATKDEALRRGGKDLDV